LDKITLPNVLSVSRLVLALPSFALVISGHWLFAAIVLMVAVATDIADGYVARKKASVSSLGGLLDHGSDAIFVTVTLSALAALELVPIVLPPLVIAAFTQYVLDSRTLSGQPLRASHIGRYNGIAYFVLAGFPTMQHALGIYLLTDPWFMYIGWLLVLTTVVSMTDRLVALLRKPPQ
jgi:phosphatidylglycerophosphate synthase